jgi:tetratricopeptide (TPR) repeat protein
MDKLHHGYPASGKMVPAMVRLTMQRKRAALLLLGCVLVGGAVEGTHESVAWAAGTKKPKTETPPTKTDPKSEPTKELGTAEQLELAEAQYSKLEYEQANKAAARALDASGLTHDQLKRAYRVLALTHAVIGNEAAATESFRLLLLLDPDFQVDTNLGPKVSERFNEARGFWRAQPGRPGIEIKPDLVADKVRVKLEDASRTVKKVSVHLRWGSAGEFTATELKASALDGTPVDISAPPVTGSEKKTRLEYYAQGLDSSNGVMMESGTKSAPLAFTKDTKDTGGGKSVFASPIFWIVTGVVLVGGGIGTYFFIKSRQPTSVGLRPRAFCGDVLCE